jgi:hypothetical protein
MLQAVAAECRKREAAAVEYKAQNRKKRAEEAKLQAAAAAKARAEQRAAQKLDAGAFLQRWASVKKRKVSQPAHDASGRLHTRY